jgi:hypothetical protein
LRIKGEHPHRDPIERGSIVAPYSVNKPALEALPKDRGKPHRL